MHAFRCTHLRACYKCDCLHTSETLAWLFILAQLSQLPAPIAADISSQKPVPVFGPHAQVSACVSLSPIFTVTRVCTKTFETIVRALLAKSGHVCAVHLWKSALQACMHAHTCWLFVFVYISLCRGTGRFGIEQIDRSPLDDAACCAVCTRWQSALHMYKR